MNVGRHRTEIYETGQVELSSQCWQWLYFYDLRIALMPEPEAWCLSHIKRNVIIAT